ncbi:hypothetical protein [Bacillus sp. M6-12]|uniref:hypothetical protein n=1 Tax=Bacillus sp. M6-12 TaxID=2054166 RepID=UPI0015E10A81|nr:hypothetical protein [Bacillus sp. M6-12]
MLVWYSFPVFIGSVYIALDSKNKSKFRYSVEQNKRIISILEELKNKNSAS